MIMSDEQMIKQFDKARMLGFCAEVLKTISSGSIYVAVNKGNKKGYIYIPSDVRRTSFDADTKYKLSELIKDANIKVYGGANLDSAHHLFSNLHCESIDFTSFEAHKIRNADAMFQMSRGKIDIMNLDTSHIVTAGAMFADNTELEINTEYLNFQSLKNAKDMFTRTEIKPGCRLELKDCGTHLLENTEYMFSNFMADELIIDTDVHNVEYAAQMFSHCKIKKLTLRNFRLRSADDISDFMYASTFDELILDNFEFSNWIMEKRMFTRVFKWCIYKKIVCNNVDNRLRLFLEERVNNE